MAEKIGILLIEDDLNVARFLIKSLNESGYTVLHHANGTQVLQTLANDSIQLVILDVLLPEQNGLQICTAIRNAGHTTLPILMLTALGGPENIVLGLDSGADDYMGKPFKLIEIKARIRSLLRRKGATESLVVDAEELITFTDLVLNDTSKQLFRANTEISLTSTEYRLMKSFMLAPGKVFSRPELLESVWGIDYDLGTNVVDVYVNYLRKKVEKNNLPRVIQTIVGMGYVLRVNS